MPLFSDSEQQLILRYVLFSLDAFHSRCEPTPTWIGRFSLIKYDSVVRKEFRSSVKQPPEDPSRYVLCVCAASDLALEAGASLVLDLFKRRDG